MAAFATPQEAAEHFLKSRRIKDRAAVGRDPMSMVQSLSHADLYGLWQDYRRLHDQLVTIPRPPHLHGQLWATIKYVPGEEYRWQLAAVFADVLIIQDPPTDTPADGDLLSRSWAQEVGVSPERRQPPGGTNEVGATVHQSALPDGTDWGDVLGGIEEAYKPFLKAESAWALREFPQRVANALRFVVHLAAIAAPAQVVVEDRPSGAQVSATWLSLRGVYFHAGTWGVADPNDWFPERVPDGVTRLVDVMATIPDSYRTLDEVFSAYRFGPLTGRGYVPLIPSTETAGRAAAEFFSRFLRVHVTVPYIMAGPQAVPTQTPTRIDWRPALVDRLLLDAFPAVSTASADVFHHLHTLRSIGNFRQRLRDSTRDMSDLTAEETVARLAELSRELRVQAGTASQGMGEVVTGERGDTARTSTLNALFMSAGFVISGQYDLALATGLIAASLTAAVGKRKLDPTTKLSGTDLALITLREQDPRARRTFGGRHRR